MIKYILWINTEPLCQIPDLDLEKRRTGQKVDPATGELYTKDVYDPEKYKKEVSIDSFM